jgi:DNA-binding response OmpR family regulator
MRILLVEPQAHDRSITGSLPAALSSRRIDVESTSSQGQGVEEAIQRSFSAIVIDSDGPAELIKRIRESNGTPIVVLRAQDDPKQAIELLESGADDVLTQPCDVDELVARLRSLTRRCEPGDRGTLKVDDLELFPKEMIVKRGGQTLLLTNREFDLLEYMMQHHDRVLTRAELADHVWGTEVSWNSNVIDVSIGRLRGKIHLPGLKPLIHTATGRGYMLSGMPPVAGAAEKPA